MEFKKQNCTNTDYILCVSFYVRL